MSGKNHPFGPCDILDDGSVIIQEGDNPVLTLEVVAQSQHQFAEIWGRGTYPRFGRMEYDRPAQEDEYYVPGSASLSLRTPSIPSRTINGTRPSAARGSAHHQPSAAFSIRPPRVVAESQAQVMVS